MAGPELVRTDIFRRVGGSDVVAVRCRMGDLGEVLLGDIGECGPPKLFDTGTRCGKTGRSASKDLGDITGGKAHLSQSALRSMQLPPRRVLALATVVLGVGSLRRFL